jgi:hypothetical protein
MVSGTSVAEQEVRFEPNDELSGRIMYASREFIVTGSEKLGSIRL